MTCRDGGDGQLAASTERTCVTSDFPAPATAIIVAFGIRTLDLSWLPAGTPVIVVRNDDLLDPLVVPGATFLTPETNVGFGAGVDLALAQVDTPRVVLVNPDLFALPAHWEALAGGADDELGVVPVVDRSGGRTIVVSRYPGPLATLAGGWRLGRFLPRSALLRRALVRLGGVAGRDQSAELRGRTGGRFPLATHWASFALVSLPAAAVRKVGGLSGRYFLYFEDVDLCHRLARALPRGTVVLHDLPPAVHHVGEAGGSEKAAERHRYRSALQWASQPGPAWAATRLLLSFRAIVHPILRA